MLATRNQILSAINILYDQSGESAQQLVDDMEDSEFTIIDDSYQTADLLDDTSDAPVIRLVNHMISQAVKACASDIHIEPFQDVLNIKSFCCAQTKTDSLHFTSPSNILNAL